MRKSRLRWPTDMAGITVLTDEQTAQLNAEVAVWLERGRSVQPLDRERAVGAIRALYAAVGRPTPAVLFFASPEQCVRAARILREGVARRVKRSLPKEPRLEEKLRAQLREQVSAKALRQPVHLPHRDSRPSFRGPIEVRGPSQVWAQVWDRLDTHLHARLDRRIEFSLRVHIASALREPLWVHLREHLGSRVVLQLEEQLRPRTVSRRWFGRGGAAGERGVSRDGRARKLLEIHRHETLLREMATEIQMPALEAAPGRPCGVGGAQMGECLGTWWCASAVFYDFCGRLGVRYAPEARRLLRLWLALCRETHWWVECDGIVFAADRPRVLTLDAQGRLHNERGAALAYGDGFALCAIHGMWIEEDCVLHPERISVERIEREHNVEVRRVLIGLYGHARYLKDSGATLVHQDARGKLWCKTRAEDTDLVMVEVVNATPEPDGSVRTYFLRVPPHLKTASDAVAWTFGLRSSEYHPSIET